MWSRWERQAQAQGTSLPAITPLASLAGSRRIDGSRLPPDAAAATGSDSSGDCARSNGSAAKYRSVSRTGATLEAAAAALDMERGNSGSKASDPATEAAAGEIAAGAGGGSASSPSLTARLRAAVAAVTGRVKRLPQRWRHRDVQIIHTRSWLLEVCICMLQALSPNTGAWCTCQPLLPLPAEAATRVPCCCPAVLLYCQQRHFANSQPSPECHQLCSRLCVLQ
jgi:hypothetical protein